jgi:hypothetical protein
MALAAFAIPVAFFVALVTVIHGPWSRLGRNATFVLIGHMTACILASSAAAIRSVFKPPRSTLEELFPIVIAACALCAAGVVAGTVLFWIWAGRRATRLEKAPARGAERPGWWRFAVYAGCLLFWPAGIAMLFVWNAQENARVGANSFRCSLLNMAAIAIGVCVAFPIVVRMIG